MASLNGRICEVNRIYRASNANRSVSSIRLIVAQGGAGLLFDSLCGVESFCHWLQVMAGSEKPSRGQHRLRPRGGPRDMPPPSMARQDYPARLLERQADVKSEADWAAVERRANPPSPDSDYETLPVGRLPCVATTTTGARCKNKKRPGIRVCGLHANAWIKAREADGYLDPLIDPLPTKVTQ